MKPITIALLAAAGLAVSAARADHNRVIVSGHIQFGAPAPVYAGHSYCPPPVSHYAPVRGYWQDVVVKTWVPERWVVRHDRWGRPVRTCEPGYYAHRTERVWVDGYTGSRHPGRGHAYGPNRR